VNEDDHGWSPSRRFPAAEFSLSSMEPRSEFRIHSTLTVEHRLFELLNPGLQLRLSVVTILQIRLQARRFCPLRC
jgi:hypothetical protein